MATLTRTHRRSGARSAAALLATLALAGGLAGCGGDGTDTATDPDPTSSPSRSTTETTPEPPGESPEESTGGSGTGAGGRETIPAIGSAGVTEVVLLSATEGGGAASTLAFALDTEQAVADFAAQLEAGFGQVVTEAAAEVAEPGATTYGATSAVGCDGPVSVAVEAGEAGFEVVPRLPKSSVQCQAPMTYVVLFAVPDA